MSSPGKLRAHGTIRYDLSDGAVLFVREDHCYLWPGEALNKRIGWAKREYRITAAAIARRLGCSRAYVAKMFRGQAGFRLDAFGEFLLMLDRAHVIQPIDAARRAVLLGDRAGAVKALAAAQSRLAEDASRGWLQDFWDLLADAKRYGGHTGRPAHPKSALRGTRGSWFPGVASDRKKDGSRMTPKPDSPVP